MKSSKKVKSLSSIYDMPIAKLKSFLEKKSVERKIGQGMSTFKCNPYNVAMICKALIRLRTHSS